MISRHTHRNTGVGCGIRLLKQQLAIRLGYQRTITKSLVIAVLALLEKLLANPLSRKNTRQVAGYVSIASALPPWSCFDCALK